MSEGLVRGRMLPADDVAGNKTQLGTTDAMVLTIDVCTASLLCAVKTWYLLRQPQR